MKNTTFTMITVLLVSIIGFCIAGTVKGQESGGGAEREAYYREEEAQLLNDTRAYLTKQGFANSGVTLNRMVNADGSREYTFTIHHSRIDKMTDGERQDLANQLSAREIPILEAETFVNAVFHYEFLTL